ncbi:MAG: energy-coupling factor transporter transmembrane component T [Brachymonas sp.]|nr:energy-coupling factor transporter transmembrane component T [Brachymonas sp.]
MSAAHPATPGRATPGPTAPSPGTPALARWDMRLRLLALLLLAFAFSTVKQLRALPLMLAATVIFWLLSGLPLRSLLRRLRYPSVLLAGMALAVLLRDGPTPWLQLGRITISREGAHAAAMLLARFYSMLILAFAFLSASSLLHVIEGLRALRLPYILVDMALLMARYLETLRQDLHHMNLAARLRGFRNAGWSLRTLKTQSWLAASLLLRSYERADGVYQAMRLRGYGQGAALRQPAPSKSDWLFFALTLGLAALLFGWG